MSFATEGFSAMMRVLVMEMGLAIGAPGALKPA
jgi:hypothetical protein